MAAGQGASATCRACRLPFAANGLATSPNGLVTGRNGFATTSNGVAREIQRDDSYYTYCTGDEE